MFVIFACSCFIIICIHLPINQAKNCINERRCLKHYNSFTCAILKPDFHNFLIEYNPTRATFVMGMVFSANLAMIKMYQVQNVYIVDIIVGGGESLQHSEMYLQICGYMSLRSIFTIVSQ